MINVSSNREKRGSRRAFFTLDDEVFATLKIPGVGEQIVPVKLLSISAGGIGVVAVRCKIPELHVGDQLTLTNIQTPLPLGPIEHAEVSVKYIADDFRGFRMCLGCEFLDISPAYPNKISNYVRNRFICMGLDA